MEQIDKDPSLDTSNPIDHNEAIERAVAAQGDAFAGLAEIAFNGLIKRLKERADAKRKAEEENTKKC